VILTHKIRDDYKNNKYVYLGIFLSALLFFFYFLFFKQSAIADFLLSSIFFVISYYYYKIKHNISTVAFLFLLIAIIVNLLGATGLYAYFAVGIIGYDKLVHLISSFAVGYALLQISTEKKMFIRYSFIILVVIGLGALVEINEFIGTAYFGINNGGIFTIGDGLSLIRSDLQKYDTYYDMITNLLGASLAVFFVILRKWFKKKYI